MKGIFKIEDYLPERNSIIVKFCKLHSLKSIDEYTSKIVNSDDLDMTDCETFVDSLMEKVGNYKIERQEEREPILEDNEPETVCGVLNIENFVGKVIEGKSNPYRINPYRRYFIKMRKIDL